MDKYSYKLHRTLKGVEMAFFYQFVLDKNELTQYIASDEFKAKEQGKLSCAAYTKENLVHYLNDHSMDQIIDPNAYPRKQGKKFHWDENWLDQLFSKHFEENKDSYKDSNFTERFVETVVSYMGDRIEQQFWTEYLPEYQTNITNTIKDYNLANGLKEINNQKNQDDGRTM